MANAFFFSDLSLGIDQKRPGGDHRASTAAANPPCLKFWLAAKPADGGMVAYRQDLRIAFQTQSPQLDPAKPVLEALFDGDHKLARLVADYEQVSHALEVTPDDPKLMTRLHDLVQAMDAGGAWDYETRAKTILTQLGIRDFEVPVGQLSGGYRRRLSLAHALLAEPDLLILDEPTNHLDAQTVDWLEGYLATFGGALIMVTHDRYLLDRVCTRQIEIDRGQVYFYEGDYSDYVEKKAQLEADAARQEDRRRNILRNELKWLMRGARARSTKQKARIQRFDQLSSVSGPQAQQTVEFQSGARRLGKKIIELKDVCKGFEQNALVDQFSYTFAKGDRLGVVGPNGCGKTTLVNLLAGRLEPDAGQIDTGETVHLGYFDQESSGLDPEEKALDYVRREGGPMIRMADGAVLTAAQAMERFGFPSGLMYTPVGKLSGGEQRPSLPCAHTHARSQLPHPGRADQRPGYPDSPIARRLSGRFCRLPAGRLTRSLLPGPHGRKVSLFRSGRFAELLSRALRDFWRSCAASAWTNKKKQAARIATKSVPATPASPAPSAEKKRLSYMEQREFGRLEEEIMEMEARMDQLREDMLTFSTDHTRMRSLSDEQTLLQQRLTTATAPLGRAGRTRPVTALPFLRD